MQAHQHTPPFIFLAPAYIGVPSPSFSLYPRQVPAVYLSKQKKKGGTDLLCGFCFVFLLFWPTLQPFLSPSSSSTPLPTSSYDKRTWPHTLYLSIFLCFSLRCPSPHLFLLSPVFMYLGFSLKPSAPESPLDPESPWNLDWVPAHTPTPQILSHGPANSEQTSKRTSHSAQIKCHLRCHRTG